MASRIHVCPRQGMCPQFTHRPTLPCAAALTPLRIEQPPHQRETIFHLVAEQSDNYWYSNNHQVVIDADTRLVVVVGQPLTGHRDARKAWEESGAKAAAGRTLTTADGGYPGTGLLMPHLRRKGEDLPDWREAHNKSRKQVRARVELSVVASPAWAWGRRRLRRPGGNRSAVRGQRLAGSRRCRPAGVRAGRGHRHLPQRRACRRWAGGHRQRMREIRPVTGPMTRARGHASAACAPPSPHRRPRSPRTHGANMRPT